jgi:CRP-like cAMP-binding protein
VLPNLEEKKGYKMSPLEASKPISHISISSQIVSGSIKIDSIEEFDRILDLFPDDPDVLRLYSDMLLEKNRPDDAAVSYAKTAELFLDSGMMLQAITAKSSQWKINPPSDLNEARRFFSKIQKRRFLEVPLNSFLANLSHPAILAIANSLVQSKVPDGKLILKEGDPDGDLVIVISGKLKETTYQPVEIENETLYRKSKLILMENDFFGNFFPVDSDNLSHSYVETISQVELARISKENLSKICKKHQDIEMGIIDLIRIRSSMDTSRNDTRPFRKGSRYSFVTKIALRVFQQLTGKDPLIMDGYSRDLSIGGICLVAEETGMDMSTLSTDIQNTTAQISMESEGMVLSVGGTITWSRIINIEGREKLALGVRFKEMSPKLKGMLFSFADTLCGQH